MTKQNDNNAIRTKKNRAEAGWPECSQLRKLLSWIITPLYVIFLQSGTAHFVWTQPLNIQWHWKFCPVSHNEWVLLHPTNSVAHSSVNHCHLLPGLFPYRVLTNFNKLRREEPLYGPFSDMGNITLSLRLITSDIMFAWRHRTCAPSESPSTCCQSGVLWNSTWINPNFLHHQKLAGFLLDLCWMFKKLWELKHTTWLVYFIAFIVM